MQDEYHNHNISFNFVIHIYETRLIYVQLWAVIYLEKNILKFVQSYLLYGGLSPSYMGYMNSKIELYIMYHFIR